MQGLFKSLKTTPYFLIVSVRGHKRAPSVLCGAVRQDVVPLFRRFANFGPLVESGAQLRPVQKKGGIVSARCEQPGVYLEGIGRIDKGVSQQFLTTSIPGLQDCLAMIVGRMVCAGSKLALSNAETAPCFLIGSLIRFLPASVDCETGELATLNAKTEVCWRTIPEGQSWFLTKGRRGLEQKVAKETKVWVSRFERACGGGVGAKTPSGGCRPRIERYTPKREFVEGPSSLSENLCVGHNQRQRWK